jgi:hypothetical protein
LFCFVSRLVPIPFLEFIIFVHFEELVLVAAIL